MTSHEFCDSTWKLVVTLIKIVQGLAGGVDNDFIPQPPHRESFKGFYIPKKKKYHVKKKIPYTADHMLAYYDASKSHLKVYMISMGLVVLEGWG